MADAGVLQLNYAGYIWYDPDSTFLFGTGKARRAAVHRLHRARMCELGFDELLFDEFGYPTRGRLNNIDESRAHILQERRTAQLAEEASQRNAGIRRPPFRAADAATVLAGWNETAAGLAARLPRPSTASMRGNDGGAAPRAHRGSGAVDAELVPILSEAPASAAICC